MAVPSHASNSAPGVSWGSDFRVLGSRGWGSWGLGLGGFGVLGSGFRGLIMGLGLRV